MQLIWFWSPKVWIHFTSLKIISSLFALYLVLVNAELNETVPFATNLYPRQLCSLYAAAKGEKMWLSWLFS